MEIEQLAKEINLYIMCSSKGGVGKTTVATSFVLSKFLVENNDTQMILFDFNIHNSDLYETFQYLKSKKHYTAIPLLSDIFLITIHNIDDKIFLIKPLGYVLEEHTYKTQHNTKKKAGSKSNNYFTKQQIDSIAKGFEAKFSSKQIIRVPIKTGEKIYISSEAVEHMSTYLMLSLFYSVLKFLEKKYTAEKIQGCLKNILIDTDYHIKYFLDYSNSESIFNSFMNSVLLEYQKNKNITYKRSSREEIQGYTLEYKNYLENVNLVQKLGEFFKLEEEKNTFLNNVKFTFIYIFDISASSNLETLNKIVEKYSRFDNKDICIVYLLNFYSNVNKKLNRELSEEIKKLLKKFQSNSNEKNKSDKANKTNSESSQPILSVFNAKEYEKLLTNISKLLKEENMKDRNFIGKVLLEILNQDVFDHGQLKYSNFWFLPFFETLENIIAVIKNISIPSKISIQELMNLINKNTSLNEIILILNMFLNRYSYQIKFDENKKVIDNQSIEASSDVILDDDREDGDDDGEGGDVDGEDGVDDGEDGDDDGEDGDDDGEDGDDDGEDGDRRETKRTKKS